MDFVLWNRDAVTILIKRECGLKLTMHICAMAKAHAPSLATRKKTDNAYYRFDLLIGCHFGSVASRYLEGRFWQRARRHRGAADVAGDLAIAGGGHLAVASLFHGSGRIPRLLSEMFL